MDGFQQEIIDVLGSHSPVRIVGGSVRDMLLGLNSSKDLDIVCLMPFDEIENILKDNGFQGHKIGKHISTVSVFRDKSRVDIVSAESWEKDAWRRDFTLNAIFLDPFSQELYDPLEGKKDLVERKLRACGDPEQRFREDPVRILRMVKIAVQFSLNIERETLAKATELVYLLESVAKERITAELAAILILPEAETAVRMLEEIGYLRLFIPELARLKGIVQNKYHSLDVWEHSLAVFRNTPPELYMRLAGLFHDIGKWEVASRECTVQGKLALEKGVFRIDKYRIIATRGEKELTLKLKPLLGQVVKILGANLDHYPKIVQFKRLISIERLNEGLVYVENGKRHFLDHEKASTTMLVEILKRFTFSMFLGMEGAKREKDLLTLVQNHMKGTTIFRSELKEEKTKRSFRDRATELVWELCWNGRSFESQKIHDFVLLWKADVEAGKRITASQREIFEQIFNGLISIAQRQLEVLASLNWDVLNQYAAKHNLAGRSLGEFKDFVRKKVIFTDQKILTEDLIKKIFIQFKNAYK